MPEKPKFDQHQAKKMLNIIIYKEKRAAGAKFFRFISENMPEKPKINQN